MSTKPFLLLISNTIIGRLFSLHRVTQIEGINSRCIALPTFVDDACRINRPQRSIDVFGRALPIHYERESYRPDAITE